MERTASSRFVGLARISVAVVAVLVTVAATVTVVTPAPARADTLGVEIVSGQTWGTYRADVMSASTEPMKGVFLWPDNASLSQEFDLLDSGNGFFRIRARHSGQCLMLDWRSGTYTNGTPVVQYPHCSAGYAPGEWSSEWIWYPGNGCTGCLFDGRGWLRLVKNRATGMCLDTANPAGGSPGQGAVLQQWQCITSSTQWNSWNQMWSFV
ncbi:RICIN domain-containing protein [Micromonospora cathayae]|uniref:RICIN domain-containing protein n=1 Tax=Micromonospora cathayae TaxID=3028804 RepID=A0ABY7ZL04_9ACTN|nr:RICIN domain-containing protein [Micromonospora sp. HUAS 3]WDZ83644.1 RICIN domain-containing protein [Micromonospora sp. HUAS 3]